MAGRTPIGRFIKYKWAAISQRAGIHRHSQTIEKCKTYANIHVRFTQPEFKNWCLERQDLILSLKRPSIDRINSKLDYTLDNIQVIELADNIRKDKLKAKDGFCECFYCKEVKPLGEFVKDKRRLTGRGTACSNCERLRQRKVRLNGKIENTQGR